MSTHSIPRNVKGEGRILAIFSVKALIYTIIGGAIGLGFYYLFSLLKIKYIGIGFIALFAVMGFTIGTFKIPESRTFEITRKAGGTNIDEAILRYIKFKQKKNRIYLYTKEGKNNGSK